MRTITLEDGQSLQIGEITVTVPDVGEEEVLLKVECPDGPIVESGNSALVMQWEWRLE